MLGRVRKESATRSLRLGVDDDGVQLSCKEGHFLFPINHIDLTRVQHHPMGSTDEIC
jgi:predicted GH43/DUF377 family glycosyl hydrolase